MNQHLALTKKEAAARLEANWKADVGVHNRVHVEILHMSEMLSDGIVRQFSMRF